MVMPKELVFIRHGQSELNVVTQSDDHDLSPELVARIRERPDWQQRLSQLGIAQALQAKEWVDENLGGAASFDACYVSPFFRTRQTAAYVGGEECDSWVLENNLVERSWGTYGMVDRSEQAELFPLTHKLHQATPWFTRLDGGESMPDVLSRYREFQATLHRNHSNQRVLAVSHGDFMGAVRYGIERMLPEQWEAMLHDVEYKIRNCTILQYSRVNPDDATDVRDGMHWSRMIYPDAVDESPDGGRWVESPGRTRYGKAELLGQVAVAGPFIESPHMIAAPAGSGAV